MKRNEGESFEDYKKKRNIMNVKSRRALAPKVLWNSLKNEYKGKEIKWR